VRGFVTPVMEGMALWHERDISHSSLERVALPDAALAADYLVHLTTGVIRGLTVNADRMAANLASTGGLIYTSSVLLDLVAEGMSREDAYTLVQGAAMAAADGGAAFREALRSRAAAAGHALDEARLDEAFRPQHYVARLGPVFDRLRALR
jgi:adenylosuccinate lyase